MFESVYRVQEFQSMSKTGRQASTGKDQTGRAGKDQTGRAGSQRPKYTQGTGRREQAGQTGRANRQGRQARQATLGYKYPARKFDLVSGTPNLLASLVADVLRKTLTRLATP